MKKNSQAENENSQAGSASDTDEAADMARLEQASAGEPASSSDEAIEGTVTVRPAAAHAERDGKPGAPANQTAPFKAITSEHPRVLVISGSPRKRTSTALIKFLEQGMLETIADDGTPLVRIDEFLLADKTINPCLACGICSRTGECIFRTKPEAYAKVANEKDRFKRDDYDELIGLMEDCDMLVVVSPVYFAGPPAQLKCLYDRCQPYWARRYVLHQEPPLKRKAHLFFVGSGGDPHGFEPLVTISKSALQVAGFLIDKVNNYVGFLSPAQAPRIPDEMIYDKMGEGQKYRLGKAIEAQSDFEQRAVFAGRAMARQIVGEKRAAAQMQAANERAVEELGAPAAAALATLGEEPSGEPAEPPLSNDDRSSDDPSAEMVAPASSPSAEAKADAEAAEDTRSEPPLEG